MYFLGLFIILTFSMLLKIVIQWDDGLFVYIVCGVISLVAELQPFIMASLCTNSYVR